jgi:uncharacterized protein YndB with AHSA1/START domain
MSILGKTDRIELASVEIEQEVAVAAAPQHVYECFMNDIARWWSASWVMGGPNTVGLLIEAQPGGRLLESWKDGGGCVWATVQSISPGRMINFSIPDGVMWSGPGMFKLSFEADEAGTGTLLKLSHYCFTMYSEDAHSGYVQGWTELIGTRLRDYAEGRPVEGAISPGATLT